MRAVLLLIVILAFFPWSHVLASGHIERQDAVRLAALKHVIEKHSNSLAERKSTSAYIIEGASAEVLAAAFLGHIPPVIHGIKPRATKHGIVHPQTKKEVKTWSADLKHLGLNTAVVSVSWYRGPLAAGSAEYHLRLRKGKWVVESQSEEVLS
ncbi:MAG: hypothetical protein EOP84_12100 [Verrucomicrobiaceae bacterium]|nr:MAG: hypothetical protein EOP84_12100 [Verrucomicrobiaceae bacterium]